MAESSFLMKLQSSGLNPCFSMIKKSGKLKRFKQISLSTNEIHEDDSFDILNTLRKAQ